MNIKYNRLFQLSLAHGFYEDGVNRNLLLRPDVATTRLLANGKMLFKTLGNQSLVIFKTDTDTISPFVDLGPDLNLRFYLTTENSNEFFNITKLDNYEAGNKLYFSNIPANASNDSSNPEALTHSLIDKAFAKLFTYSFTLTTNHTITKFRIEDSNGQPVSPGKDANGGDLPTILTLNRDDAQVFSQQVDLRDKPNEVYTIFIDSQANINLKTETVLIDNEGIAQGILGVVDIKYTAVNTIYVNTDYFRLQFDRKTTIWKYFIVNKSKNVDLNTTSLKIEDSPSGGGSPYTHVDFIVDGAQPNATVQVKGFETVIFRSNAVIPSFEQPKLNVQLLDDGIPNKELVKHLPNPPVNSVEKKNGIDLEKEIFVFI